MTSRTPDLISGKTMFRVGLGLVVGAFAYFLRYAIENEWLGPVTQLLLAAGGGLAMIVVGEHLLATRRGYGGLMQGGGSAVLYLTAFAAHHRLGLLGVAGAAVALGVVSAGVVGLAYRNGQEALAAVGLGGALVAPFLLGSGFDAPTLAAVTATAVYLYLERQWRLVFLSAAALSIVMVGLGGLGAFGPKPDARSLLIGTSLAMVGFWVGSLMGAMRRPNHLVDASVIPVLAATGLPLIGYGVATTVLGVQPRVTLALAVAAALGVTMVLVRRSPAPSVAGEVQLVPAAILASVAWFDGFDLHAAVMVVTLQVVAMVVLGARHRHRSMLALGYAGLGILTITWPGRALIASDSVFDLADLSSLSTVVGLAAAGMFIRQSDDETIKASGIALLGLAMTTGLVWPMASLEPIHTGLLTAGWAVAGLISTIAGKVRGSMLVRNSGLAVLVITVIKLLVVDTAAVPPLGRIGLFAGIGLALLGVGMWLGDEDVIDTGTVAGDTPGSGSGVEN